MYEEAVREGFTCTLFGDHETVLMEKDGKRFFTRGSRTSLQSSVGKTIADYKPLTKAVLAHYQLPTANFQLVEEEKDLEKISVLHFPLVLKPVAGEHGKGVIVGIADLAAASAAFKRTGEPVLFEEMLHGTEYRIVCVNYHFLAAAFRKPAHVIGDGIHTIQQLVDEKNKHPWRGTGHTNNLSLITIDETVVNILADQHLTPETVPAEDREVILRKTANLSTGGEAWDVTDQVCPENRELFERIARACDLNVTGIDIMCQSLSTPIVDQPHAGVIEVNASPGLRMHHFPMKGTPQNIAKSILAFVMNTL
jgi:cyanophycin synthetase